MSGHVYQRVEFFGPSIIRTGEIRRAFKTAPKTLRHTDWLRVIETRGRIGRRQDRALSGHLEGRHAPRGLSALRSPP
jgi:flavin-binding protein dodecin